MNSTRIQTLSLINSTHNCLPHSTPSKVVLPLIFKQKFFYSTLPLYSQELSNLTDLDYLESYCDKISEFVDFKKIRQSYYIMFYSVMASFFVLFGLLILINYFVDKPFVLVIVLLVLLLLFIFTFIRIVDYSFRFYSWKLLQKVLR